jgi:Domain of Unknown Function (DUF1080)
MTKKFFTTLALMAGGIMFAQAQQTMKPEETEVWTPVPKVVTPGKSCGDAPSDAMILFDGKNLNQWVLTNDTTKQADWIVGDGVITVNKKSGNIQTKQSFTDYQLHIEWKVPSNITGTGQGRGNSGLFLASTGPGDDGYELQIMDSYNNPTYVNGQAGSIYKQFPPLVNANFPPGTWQTYDVAWTAPRFNEDGSLKSPARVTVYFNGILIQNNTELKGQTRYIGQPSYKAYGPAPVKLQAHGDKSEPISFRNIWIRPL